MIFLPDPLKYGGELIVREVTGDNRLLCEAVYYESEHEDWPPPRGLFEPHELELADRWARTK